MVRSEWNKDPSAVLDYKFDWKALTNGNGDTDWLGATETISSRTVTVSAGLRVDPTAAATDTNALTKDSDSSTDTNTSVTVWLSKGTHGYDYTVACKIVTSLSRTDERTMKVKVRDR